MSTDLLTRNEAEAFSENNACPDHSASAEGRALFYLDNDLICLYSTDDSIVTAGVDLGKFLTGSDKSREGCFSCFIGGEYYSAMLSRIESGYICELFSRDVIEEMLCKSRLMSAVMPNICNMEQALSELWQSFYALRRDIPADKAEAMRCALYRLTSRQRKLTDLPRVTSVPVQTELFELGSFCHELMERCNRSINDPRAVRLRLRSHDKIFVRMDGANAVTALTHAIQNSLKYSPEGSGVSLEVTAEEHEGISRAVISVRNITDRQLTEADISLRMWMGTGLRLIRNFAEMESGSFELVMRDNMVTAVITLPAVPLHKAAGRRIGSLSQVLADKAAGLPDVIDVMMSELTDGERY